MRLLLDLGNSELKWAWQGQGVWLSGRGRSVFDAEHEPEEILLAATGDPTALIDALNERWPVRVWRVRSQAESGRLKNSYQEPERMGVDRWLAMLAGAQLSEGAFAVLDLGTALTADFVDSGGQHQEGWIAPGQELMQTSVLRETAEVANAAQGGTDTRTALAHGCINAVAGFARQAMTRARELLGDDAPLFVCGGWASLVPESADTRIRHVPDLVLRGLAQWSSA